MTQPINATVKYLQKAPNGIAGLDELTFGGLPKGRPTSIAGAAGCGKTLFAPTFLVNRATAPRQVPDIPSPTPTFDAEQTSSIRKF